MTTDPAEPAATLLPPAEAPEPGPEAAAQIPARVPAPASEPPPSGPLSDDEEAQLAALQARKAASAPPPAAPAGMVLIKVEPPHASFSYGGATAGSEFSPVPGYLAAAFFQSAAEAGVMLTQAEEG